MQLLAVLVALTATALAVPTAAPACKTYNYTDKFDDLTVGAVPALTPLNLYGALNYSGIVYFRRPDISLLETPSDFNIISFGPISDATLGPALLLPGPKTDRFSLKSVRYACAVNDEVPAVGVPVACTIRFSGMSKSGKTLVREFVYSPAVTVEEQAYATADLTPFSDVVSVGVELVQDVTDLVKIPVFDNVVYSACVRG